MSLLGDCGSATSSGLKDAVKRKSPDSVRTEKEKDAVKRKSPDSVLTEKEMDALAAAQEKPLSFYEMDLKMALDLVRDMKNCLLEDPDYFSKLTGLDAVFYKAALDEVEEEREERAEEERKSQQFLLTQK